MRHTCIIWSASDCLPLAAWVVNRNHYWIASLTRRWLFPFKFKLESKCYLSKVIEIKLTRGNLTMEKQKVERNNLENFNFNFVQVTELFKCFTEWKIRNKYIIFFTQLINNGVHKLIFSSLYILILVVFKLSMPCEQTLALSTTKKHSD